VSDVGCEVWALGDHLQYGTLTQEAANAERQADLKRARIAQLDGGGEAIAMGDMLLARWQMERAEISVWRMWNR